MIPKALFPSRRTRRNRITPGALWRCPFRSKGKVGWRLLGAGRVEGCSEIMIRWVFGMVNERGGCLRDDLVYCFSGSCERFES